MYILTLGSNLVKPIITPSMTIYFVNTLLINLPIASSKLDTSIYLIFIDGNESDISFER